MQAVFLTSGRHLIVRDTHCLLTDKLRQLVIPNPLIRWISSYLLNWVQQVGVLGELLSPPAVFSGGLLWDRWCSWFMLMACRESSYLVAVLCSLLMTFCFTTWSVTSASKIFKTTLVILTSHKLSLNMQVFAFSRLPTVLPTLHVNGSVLDLVSSYFIFQQVIVH